MVGGVLTKNQILERIKTGNLKFTPGLDKFQLQTHSIDLRLGYSFMLAKQWELTEKGRETFLIDYTDTKKRFEVIELEKGQYFELLPRESVIVSSLEEVEMPDDLMATLFPRSSVNRRGLTVDLSGIIDAGFAGNLVIPVKNNTNNQIIRVYPGERFCQLVLFPLSDAVKPEKSRWHKKDIIVGSLNEKRKLEEEMILKGKISDLKKKYALFPALEK